MTKKKKIIIGAILIIVLAVMVVVNIKKSRGDSVDVTITKVKQGDITETVSGSGYVQPEVDVEISARISSEIIEIHVLEGNKVSKGQLLVELDRQRYEALVQRAESGVKSAQAALKKSQADYQRIKGLYDQNLKSQAELDAAEADRLLAESQLEQAQATLREANDNLAKTRLVSPINGVVTRLNKETGEIAVGSEFQADPIMTVSDLSRMEVLAEIDENEVVLVDIGQHTDIEVDAIPDTIFKGTVSEIAHTATTRGRGTQEQVTNFEVKIAIDSPTAKLRPGMSSTVDIRTNTQKDVLYVPIQCVTMREVKNDSSNTDNTEQNPDDSSMQKVVFVVQDGSAKMVPVETGISDDTNIEIKSGLEKDQQVVSGSYKAISRELEDGKNVNIKKEENSNNKEK